MIDTYEYSNSVIEKLRLDLINEYEEYSEILDKNGVVKRAKYLPVWLKNGVYYRDRGRCQICGKDMSGLLITDKVIRCDHIISLEQGEQMIRQIIN